MTDSAVVLSEEEGIATVTLNQPDRRNPFSSEIVHGMEEALNSLGDPRVVVIEGAGPAFSAGGDIDAMRERFEQDVPAGDRVEELAPGGGIIERLHQLSVPTVAKVDGAAVGAGATLAIACDMQLASENALFGFVFKNVGLSIDAGTSYFLPRIVGTNVAKELVYTGELVGAEKALELGLVNHVFEESVFDEEARGIIEEIASGPTVALNYSGQLLESGIGCSLEEAMRAEAVAGGVVYSTEDHQEGVMAFIEDRDAEFKGK